MHPWQRLGLEPTDDTVAIKRAYARELKKTRPDDDAEGYQALRQAYEWALDYARWRRENPDYEDGDEEYEDEDAPEDADAQSDGSTAPEEPAAGDSGVEGIPAATRVDAPLEDRRQTQPPAPLLEHEPMAPADDGLLDETQRPPARDGVDGFRPLGSAGTGDAVRPPAAWSVATGEAASHPDDGLFDGTDSSSSVRPEDEPDEEIDLQDLIEQLERRWRTEGPTALLASWPALEQTLDDLPFGQRAEASYRFASFAVEHSDLPSVFLLQLSKHFHWGADFRVDAQLGHLASELTIRREQALQELRRARSASDSSWSDTDAVLWQADGWPDSDDPVPVYDSPEARRQLVDVFRLHRLWLDGARFKTLLYALLAHPALGERLRGLDLSAFDIRLQHSEGLRTFAGIALVARSALLVVLFFVLSRPDDTTWLTWLALCGLLASLFGAASVLAQALGTYAWRGLDRVAPRLMRGGHLRFLLAALVSVSVGLLSWMDEPRIWVETQAGAWAPALALAATGLAVFLAWPRQRSLRLIMVPLAALLGLVAFATDDGGLFSAAGFGLSWLILLLWITDRYEGELAAIGRKPGPFLVELLKKMIPTSIVGWILTLLLLKGYIAFLGVALVIFAPLTVLLAGLAKSRYTALAITGVALGWSLMLDTTPDFNLLVIGKLLLAWGGVMLLLRLSGWLWRLFRLDRVNDGA